MPEAFFQLQLHLVQRLLEVDPFSYLFGDIKVNMDVPIFCIILIQFFHYCFPVNLVGMDDAVTIRFKCVSMGQHQRGNKFFSSLDHDDKRETLLVHVPDIVLAEVSPVKDETNLLVLVFLDLVDHIGKLGNICDGAGIFLIEQWNLVIFVEGNTDVEDRQAFVILGFPIFDEVNISCLTVLIGRIVGDVDIMIPCYNEEENIVAITDAVVAQMEQLPQYDYEIVVIDNCSKDNTRPLIREICAKNKKIKAIFNVKNFGQFNSPVHGMMQTSGDCTITMCADFQDPVELIPEFLKYWEEGYQIVCGVKSSSRESRLMYGLRSIYYKLIKKYSSVEQIEHFTGFGLYDKSFIEFLRNLKDPTPFIRGIVAELGGKRKDVEYEQPKRRAGKTHNNWYTLYDAAMLSFTSYTKIGLRLATFLGVGVAMISFLVTLIYLILKLCNWYNFDAGQAPILIGMFFLGSVQLIFLGVIGEYILSMNQRIMNRPLVVEEERINFE